MVRVLVSGYVQGVGFRQFVKHNARKIGLTGWVKNLSDNRVEALFYGPKEKIGQVISICEKGPFLSEVKDIVVDWEENPKYIYETFEIVV